MPDTPRDTGHPRHESSSPRIPPTDSWPAIPDEPEDLEPASTASYAMRPPDSTPGAGAPASTPSWVPPRPEPLAPGATLGRYALRRVLGRGGMGIVYEAWDAQHKRSVALKTLHLPDRAADGTLIERFVREARSAAKLRHPGIVTVLDVDQDKGRHFFTMEYVEGRSFEKCLRAPDAAVEFPLRRRIEILQQVAEALGHAHRAGVIHRDVKPSNILISTDGSARLTDFGLAGETAASDLERLTLAGVILGTPQYVSPEQAQGGSRRAVPASDVYSLGVVLYRAITGRVPFEGEGAQVIEAAARGEVQPPRELNPHVPAALEAVVMKCLSKNPGERYRNGDALAADLRRFLEGRPLEATAAPTRRHEGRSGRPIVMAAAAGVALLSLAAVALVVHLASRGPRPAASAPAGVAPASLDRPTLAPVSVDPALSQDQAPARAPQAVLGEAALARGDLPEAAASFRIALRATPRDGRSRMALAWSVFWLATIENALEPFLDGRTDTARARALRKEAADALAALETPPLSARDRMLAAALFAASRGEEAVLKEVLANAEPLAASDPAAATPFLLAGALATGPDRRKLLAETAHRFRNDPVAAVLAGFGADPGKHADEALSFFDAAIRSAPRFGAAHLGRALALRGTTRTAEARAAFDAAIAAWPAEPAAIALRGIFLEENADPRAALADYEASLRIDPSRPCVFIRRGDLRAGAGDWTQALAAYDAAAALLPGRPDIISRRAVALLRLEDWRASLAAADEALALDPADPKAWMWRGVAHSGLRDDEGALADFTRATDLDPASAEAWNNRAYSHLRLGQWKETLEAVRVLGGLRKVDARMLYFRGAANRHLGNLPAAEADLLEAIQREPGDADFWLELAQVREARGDRKGRVEAARKVLELAPAEHPGRDEAKRLAEGP